MTTPPLGNQPNNSWMKPAILGCAAGAATLGPLSAVVAKVALAGNPILQVFCAVTSTIGGMLGGAVTGEKVYNNCYNRAPPDTDSIR